MMIYSFWEWKSDRRGKRKIDIQDLVVKTEKRRTVVEIHLDITASTVDSLEESFFMALEKNPASVILLDLRDVEVVDSIGVGSLIKLHKELQRQGRELILRGLSPDLLEVFQWMRLDKHFSIEGYGNNAGE